MSTNLPTLRRLGALRILVALVLLALVAACGSSSSNVDVKVVQSTLQFVPGDLSFGDQTVNTPVTQAVTLVNNGTTPVTGISVEICDGAITNSANFTCAKSTAFAGTSCPSQLDVAKSCVIQVTFQPTGVGSVNATLVATNANNLNGPPLLALLSGTGTAAVIGVTPGTLAFGNYFVGTTSAAQTVTVTNSGTAPLTVSNVKLSGAPASEFVLLNACGEVVAPGGSCTITVAFAPTAAGADAETLSLQWISGGNTATVTVALAGTGIATSATLTATALNFPGQPVGTVSPPQVVTFSNPGPVPLTLTAITIYGVNPGDLPAAYSQTNNCGYALPPNQTCQISVSFAPSIIGTANATLGILSGSATVGTVALSGSGVTGPLVSTVAGFGQARWADGTGRNAYFNGPKGIAVDAQGNVYVADTGNHVIRKVIPATGVVTTLAGVPGVPGAANGAGATASFSSPIGIAVDALGNVYVADTGNNLIRKLTVSGASVVVSTLAGTGVAGYTDSPALATDGSSAAFNAPSGIAVDAVGNVYVADAANAVIRRVLPTGVTSTFAGSGQVGWVDGIGANASFGAPYALALDGQGHLWVADQGPNNSVRAVALATRAVTSVTRQQSFGSSPAGLAVSVGGVVYSYFNCGIDTVSAAGFSPIDASFGQCGYRDGALASALFAGTSDAMVMDASGNLYVADTGNHVIRVIAPLP